MNLEECESGYYVENHGSPDVRTLSREPTLHDPVDISDSMLGRWTEVRSHSRLNDSELGDYSYLMERVQMDYVTVGKFGNVASDVRLGPTNHPIDRPTSHHFTYRTGMYDLGEDDDQVFEWRTSQPVTVGHDVWIGHGAIVLPGIEIGNGAVVGAGAVVTDDIEPYTVVVGVPAEPVHRRFPPEIARRLEATKWWDWEHETLTERLEDFRDLDTFLRKHAPALDAVE